MQKGSCLPWRTVEKLIPLLELLHETWAAYRLPVARGEECAFQHTVLQTHMNSERKVWSLWPCNWRGLGEGVMREDE